MNKRTFFYSMTSSYFRNLLTKNYVLMLNFIFTIKLNHCSIFSWPSQLMVNLKSTPNYTTACLLTYLGAYTCWMNVTNGNSINSELWSLDYKSKKVKNQIFTLFALHWVILSNHKLGFFHLEHWKRPISTNCLREMSTSISNGGNNV